MKKEAAKEIKVSVRLNDKQNKALAKLAKQSNMSKAEYVRAVVFG